MATFPTFQHVHFADYVKAHDRRPFYLHYAIDIIYTVRKDVKSMPSYFEWFYREEEEQHRPLLTYRTAGRNRVLASDRSILWVLVEPTMRYREIGDTGGVYSCRKKKKLCTRSFVRKVVRDWGYDLR